MNSPDDAPSPLDDAPIRPHVFDEIQEYDKQLPNWWLVTLYASIAFAFCYWLVNQYYALEDPVFARLDRQMAVIAEKKAAQPDAQLTNEELWAMSQDQDLIALGATTFSTTCAPCHAPDLTGKIGPSLVDDEWVHGGEPLAVVAVIRNGVGAKGMPAWGPVLGNTRVAEVAAFVLSHHEAPAGTEIDGADEAMVETVKAESQTENDISLGATPAPPIAVPAAPQ